MGARHAVLQIGGMTCSNCSFAVERALNSLDFVEKCQVDLINGKAFVHYSGGTAADLCEEVEAIGFDARVLEDEAALSGAHVVLHLLVEGKGRDAGIASLESTPGVLECRADVDELCVTFDPLHAGARDLVAVLKKHGLQVKTDHAGGKLAAEAVPRGLPTAVLLTMGIILVSDVLPCIEHCEHVLYKHLVPGLPCITVLLGALATPVQLFCGFRFHLGAYHAVMIGVWDMNVLISLGTALCFLYSLMVMLFMIVAFHIGGSTMDCKAPPPSYFETPCFVITTILVGKYLEAWARSGASQALRQLLALKPQTAHLLRGVEVEEVPAQLLQLGDTLQVFPGETVPTDGVLTSASADFDESLLTGESRPVRKAAGDVVIGGSKCVTGRVEMRVEKLGSQTMLSQIMALVEEAQLSRAPVQHIADQIARHFVPGIVALSVVTWGVWFLLVYTWQVVPLASILRGRTSNWPELDKAFFVLEHGLNVLLVACPCALGLATPTAVMAATGAAASCGILVRSGAKPLELGSQVQKVVLDKTGTLTTGKPSAVAAALVCPWAMEERAGESCCRPSGTTALLPRWRVRSPLLLICRRIGSARKLSAGQLRAARIRAPVPQSPPRTPRAGFG
ncbi:unnamed protein product [Effrenium voratum]|nr:unnamed protein product [Effrenium voratum]